MQSPRIEMSGLMDDELEAGEGVAPMTMPALPLLEISTISEPAGKRHA